MTYTTRKEAADACKYEASAAERFGSAAIEAANKGECRKAWNLADQARMAARCAMQAHEDLWELAGENMTGEEFDAFDKAEIAQVDAARAERAAAAAVEKLNRPVLDTQLEALCEATDTSRDGIAALMKYYTETCGWTAEAAVEHIKGLFDNGTIDLIKSL